MRNLWMISASFVSYVVNFLGFTVADTFSTRDAVADQMPLLSYSVLTDAANL